MILLLSIYIIIGIVFVFLGSLLNNIPTSTPNKYANFIFKNLNSSGYLPYIIGAGIGLTWPIHVLGLGIGGILK
jgi:hypothetical protein